MATAITTNLTHTDKALYDALGAKGLRQLRCMIIKKAIKQSKKKDWVWKFKGDKPEGKREITQQVAGFEPDGEQLVRTVIGEGKVSKYIRDCILSVASKKFKTARFTGTYEVQDKNGKWIVINTEELTYEF